jgi:hypothetical protein
VYAFGVVHNLNDDGCDELGIKAYLKTHPHLLAWLLRIRNEFFGATTA